MILPLTGNTEQTTYLSDTHTHNTHTPMQSYTHTPTHAAHAYTHTHTAIHSFSCIHTCTHIYIHVSKQHTQSDLCKILFNLMGLLGYMALY